MIECPLLKNPSPVRAAGRLTTSPCASWARITPMFKLSVSSARLWSEAQPAISGLLIHISWWLSWCGSFPFAILIRAVLFNIVWGYIQLQPLQAALQTHLHPNSSISRYSHYFWLNYCDWCLCSVRGSRCCCCSCCCSCSPHFVLSTAAHERAGRSWIQS